MAQFEPRSSSVLNVSRFGDVDEFRASLHQATVEVLPLGAGPIAALQAVLPLPDGELYLFRTFPRIVDVGVPAHRMFAVVPLSEQMPDVIMNGQPLRERTLVLGRGPGAYHLVEKGAGFGAVLQLNATQNGRGWPDTGRLLVPFHVPAAPFVELQELVKRAFAVASYFPTQLAAVPARLGLQEQLLAALDRAFAQTRPGELLRALSFQTSLTIIDRIEEILRLDLGQPVYSTALAARLHVSVRTMNSAMAKVRGISLHRYLRARRLWAVRRELLAGDATTQIKDRALANGFWHQSEFSSQYVARFGEHPSETLARAIARRR